MSNRLFDLLPALYRAEDLDADGNAGPLETFLAVLDEMRAGLEVDISTLYEAWFVETCEPWVLRHIGALVGAPQFEGDLDTTRRLVANQIRRARRKGTPASIEGAAADAAGWAVQLVENRRQVLTSVDVRHGLLRGCTAQIAERRIAPDAKTGPGDANPQRDWPIQPIAAPMHVVRIGQGQGATGRAPQAGAGFTGATMRVWRLSARQLDHIEARRQVDTDRWWIDPLCIARPLYALPITRDQFFLPKRTDDIPQVLTCASLNARLKAAAQAAHARTTPSPVAPPWPGLRIQVQVQPLDAAAVPQVWQDAWAEMRPRPGAWCEIPPHTIQAAPWSDDAPVGRPRPKIAAWVEPSTGRLWFEPGVVIKRVRTSHAIAVLPGALIGGGVYDRRRALAPPAPPAPAPRPERSRVLIGETPACVSLAHALGELTRSRAAWPRSLRIIDSHVHAVPADFVIKLACPSLSLDAMDGVRPTIVGDLALQNVRPQTHVTVLLGGLCIQGRIVLGPGIDLVLRDCTLCPAEAAEPENTGAAIDIAQAESAQRAHVRIERSVILGTIKAGKNVERIEIEDCILDSQPRAVALDAPSTVVEFERCTIFGDVRVRTLEASTTLFEGGVEVERHYDGFARFSAFAPKNPAVSLTGLPRILYRCQPMLTLERTPHSDARSRIAIRQRIRPHFLSRQFGAPAYAQLAWSTPREIRSGSMESEEMGVWSRAARRGRLRRLLDALERHLPANDTARLIFSDVPDRLESVMKDDQ